MENVKEKPTKETKVKKDKPAPNPQISVVAEGDFLVIRMPRKMAVKHLLNS